MNIYDDAIASASQSYGIDPGVLKGLLHQESSFKPSIIDGSEVSSAGAIGIAQFMPGTAKQVGIDPTDPIQSIFGAASYLKTQINKFGDVAKGLAAYNWGPGRMEKAVAKYGDSWTDALPPETTKYITEIAGKSIGYSQDFPKQQPATQDAPTPIKPDVIAPENKPAPTGMLGRLIKDTPVSLAAGVIDAGQTVYGLADALTFGALDKVSKYINQGTGTIADIIGDAITGGNIRNTEFVGKNNDRLSQSIKSAGNTIKDNYTPEQKEAFDKVGKAQGFFESAYAVLQNPSTIVQGGVESLPVMLTMVGAVRRVAEKMGVLAFDAAADAGLSVAAREAAREAAITKWSTGLPGIGVQATIDFLTSGAQQSQQTKTDVLEMDQKKRDASPNYQALIAKGVDPQEAWESIADKAQMIAFVVSGTLSAAASPIGSGVLGNFATKGLRKQAIDKALGFFTPKGAIAGTLAAGGKELVQEAAQSAGEQFGSNVGMLHADPTQDLSEKVGNQGAVGGLTGAGVGMGMHLATGSHGKQSKPSQILGAGDIDAAIKAGTDPNAPLVNMDGLLAKITAEAPAPNINGTSESIIPNGSLYSSDLTNAPTESIGGLTKVTNTADLEHPNIYPNFGEPPDGGGPPFGGGLVDRRVDATERKLVADMTPDEKSKALLTDDLTGIPNLRARNELARLPVQTKLDLDGLKPINDKFGHDAGDQVLQAVAKHLQDSQGDGRIYRIGGDEFPGEFRNEVEAKAAMETAREKLANTTFTFQLPDGTQKEITGIGFSYGIGKDSQLAENALIADKAARKASGLRSERDSTLAESNIQLTKGQQANPSQLADELARARQPVKGETDGDKMQRLASQGESSQVDLDAKQSISDQALPAAVQQQVDAGSVKAPRTEVAGMPIKIEVPRGDTRTGTSANGNPFSQKMDAHYGELTGTKNANGEPIKTFLGPTADNATKAFVIDQVKADRSYDEPKVMIGYKNAQSARDAYMLHYPKGWKGAGGITEMPMAKFKEWANSSAATQPLSEAVRARMPTATPTNSNEVVIGSYGSMPSKSNQLLTLKKTGSEYALFQGKNEAIDGNSGEPITYKSVAEAVADVKAEMSREDRRFLSTRQKAFLSPEFRGETNGSVDASLKSIREENEQSQKEQDAKILESVDGNNNLDSNNRSAAVDTVGKKLTKKQQENLDFKTNLENHFEVGNVIKSNYWQKYDVVKAFNWNNGNWSVTVQTVKKENGKWAAEKGEGERTHATQPSLKDVIVGNISGDSNAGTNKSNSAERAATATASGLQDAGGVRGSTEPVALDGRSQSGVKEANLTGLPTKIDVDGKEVTFGFHEPARRAAEAYTKEAGIPYNPPTDYVKVDPVRARNIAEAYAAMENNPQNAEVKAAYQALADETLAQYEAILKTGLKIEFIDFDKTGDPYGNPRNAIIDVVKNNHLWVFPTENGFGSSEFDASKNPLLAPTKYSISGKPVAVNDIFRIVHDYFGHIKEGTGFRADGEENAWRQHMAMYTALAQKAVTSETRGQNSWVNFGPNAEANKTANAGATVYADQKVGILPDWVINGSEKPNIFTNQTTSGLAKIDDRYPASPVGSVKNGYKITGGDAFTPQERIAHATKQRDMLANESKALRSSAAIAGNTGTQWELRNNKAKKTERLAENKALIDAWNLEITKANQAAANAENNVGTDRLRLNQSNGRAAQVSTPAFKSWFGDSKVVDANGNPLVVYHGTTAQEGFNKFGFDKNVELARNLGLNIDGRFFFAESADTASSYANEGAGSVMPTYLSIKNPLIIDAKGNSYNHGYDSNAGTNGVVHEAVNKAIDEGHDGVIVRNVSDHVDSDIVSNQPTTTVFVAFKQNQIKSATGNNGNFDANNPDIRFNKNGDETKNETKNETKYESEPDTDGALGKLIGDIESQTGKAIPESAVERVRLPNQLALEKIAGAFGTKIVGLRDSNNLLGINGATFPEGNVIYINADTERPHLAVIFHELGHQLEAKNPALYAQLEAAIREQIDQGKYPEFAAKYENMTASDVRGEFVSEFLADAAMTDNLGPFWSAFNKSNRSAFQKVVDFLRQMVDTVRKVAYTNEAKPYMKDFDSVLATAGDIMGKFAKAQQTDTPAFKSWFGDWQDPKAFTSKASGPVSFAVNKDGSPLMLYHATNADIKSFEIGRKTTNSGTFGSWETSRHAIFTSPDSSFAQEYLKEGSGQNVLPVYMSIKSPMDLRNNGAWNYVDDLNKAGFEGTRWPNRSDTEMWEMFDDELGKSFIEAAKKAGFDGAIMYESGDNKAHEVYVAFNPTQIKSAIGNNGNFDANNPDIRFNQVAPTNSEIAAVEHARFNKADIAEAKETSNLPDETFFQKMQRIVQDKDIRFKVVQDWLQKQGVKLSEMADVYTSAMLYPGRVAVRQQDFREQVFAPVNAELQKSGFTLSDVGTVLHAQHAEERNIKIAEINPKMPDGGSGMKTADARDIMAKADPRLLEIANKIRAITDMTLDLKLQSGIIDQETYDRLSKDGYQYYVPLKGGDETVYSGAGKGFDVKSTMKRALGHSFRDEMIVENILRDHEMSIMASEKNRVAQTLAQFTIEANDPNLITIGQPEKRAVLAKGSSLYAVKYEGSIMSAYENLNDAKNAMNTMMADAKQTGSNKWSVAKVTDQSVRYQASPMLAANEAGVYLSGKFVRMQINDPLMARAYLNQGVDHLIGVLKVGKEVNTFLSKAYTGWNPAFIFKNAIRDATEGVINLTGDYGGVTTLKVLSKYPQAFTSLLRYAATGKMTDSIADFRADGAKIGAAYLPDLDQIGQDIRKVYNDYAGVADTFKRDGSFAAARVASDKTVSKLTHFIEVANMATENAMRLATYETMRENGMSRNKASLAAKDVTLNFNRKGEIGTQASALWLFFNPSVQGAARTVQTLMYSEHKAQAWALTGAMTLLFYAMAKSNADADKDRWDQTPDYEKSHNLIIPAGKYQVKIPVPYGYGFFGGLGTAIHELQHGKDPVKVGYMLANAFAEGYSPIGNPFGDKPDFKNLAEVTPFTPLKVAFEIGVNRSGLGSPIVPPNQNEGKPDSSTMFRNTKGTLWDKIASGMNNATGGNKAIAGWVDVHPDTLKSLWATATGGTGRFITDSMQIANLMAQGATPDLPEIPIVRDFLRTQQVTDTRKEFMAAVEDSKIAQTQFTTAKKNLIEVLRGKNVEAQKDARETLDMVVERNRALLGLGSAITKFQKADSAQRDTAEAIMADTSIPLQERRVKVKEIEEIETNLYNRYISLFKEREDQQKKDELERAKKKN